MYSIVIFRCLVVTSMVTTYDNLWAKKIKNNYGE